MTAEVAVLNKNAVALAADSAVTVSTTRGRKVYNTAIKLFALSKYEPVGIMLHNSASLVGVPWELLIKLYRKQVGEQAFGTVAGWVEDFIHFLDHGNPCFPPEVQERFFFETCVRQYSEIREKAIVEIDQYVQNHGSITEAEVRQLVSRIVSDAHADLAAYRNLPDLPRNHGTTLLRHYGNLAKKARDEVFERLPLTSAASNKLRRLPAMLLSKDGITDNYTGIVVAGYGSEEIYPSLYEIVIDGVAGDRLKFLRSDGHSITATNGAIVRPFAQHEMVYTFMEGINPQYEEALDSALQRVFGQYGDLVSSALGATGDRAEALKERLAKANERLLAGLSGHMRQFRRQEYAEPVIETVAALSKDELGEMAESLVNLTSFRRRVSEPLETVGGPIDVAVISRGDGLIWLRRKHYFEPGLNPQFFANYYRG